jgi:uncharacterized membrane protein YgdD (TMEM256/DUF423 family)
MNMMNLFLFLGSALGGLSVALGAFGAHALKDRLTAELMNTFQTGVHYQMIHSLALILTAILADKLTAQSALVTWAGWLFFAGIVFFSGSLYILSTTGVKTFGAITPIGGVAFLIGWGLLAYAALRA